MLVRLQKYLADAGIASRRASEEIIRSGRVAVNGKAVREMGAKVDQSSDQVTVDGTPVKIRRKSYIALHKPTGYVCSRTDPQGRRTIADLLPREWSALYPVGRLDYLTEGLIFLTNDGDFALHLTHPRYGVSKKYQLILDGKIEPEQLAPMTKGLYHDGERLKAERTRIISASRSQSLIEIDLKEGKNREIRRLCEALMLTIKALKRVQIGPIKLGEMPIGRWRVLSASEVKALMAKAGMK